METIKTSAEIFAARKKFASVAETTNNHHLCAIYILITQQTYSQ